MMAREIPGFVFDASKDKYFRIQDNHRNTQHVALRRPPASEADTNGTSSANDRRTSTKYTREVVEVLKRHQRPSISHPRGAKFTKYETPSNAITTIPRRPTKTTHSHRQLSQEIVLQLRLRTSPHRNPYALCTINSRLTTHYAATLTGSLLSTPRTIGTSSPFIIDPTSHTLFTTTQLHPNHGEEFCAIPLLETPSTYPDPTTTNNENHTTAPHSSTHLYNTSTATPILDSSPPLTITPLTPTTILWTTSTTTHNQMFLPQTNPMEPEGTILHTSTRYTTSSDIPWQSYREDFGDWGTSTLTLPNRRLYDAASSSSSSTDGGGDSASDVMVVLGTSHGAMLRFPSGTITDVGGRATTNSSGNNSTARSYDEKREIRAVGWLDDTGHVWLGGRRDGGVVMGDVRTPDGQVVRRFRHAGGGVARVRGLGRGKGWGVLVWGLGGAGVYDLRWTKDLFVDDGGGRGGVGGGGGKVRGRGQVATRPLLQFDMPGGCMQRQYGMGFDYAEELGLVAAAYPTVVGGSAVGLWDVRTGKMAGSEGNGGAGAGVVSGWQRGGVDGGGDGLAWKGGRWKGRLSDKMFSDTVGCMQFVDLEGQGEGVKTLVIATEGRLERWDV